MIRFLSIVLLLLICAFKGQGQKTLPVTLQVKTLNVEEGLSQSTVNQVFQDHNGLIWVVTGGGLQYFDGSGFRSFDPPGHLSKTIGGNIIREIAETVSGEFMLSTPSILLNFNSSSGTFQVPGQRSRQFPFLFTTSLKGIPLCWLSKDGLCIAQEDTIRPLPLIFDRDNRLPSPFVPMKSCYAPYGKIWIAGKNGLLQIDTLATKGKPAYPARWIPFPSPIRDLVRAPDGHVFLLAGESIWKFTSSGSFEKLNTHGIKRPDRIFIDRNGTYWITDYTRENLYRISNGLCEKVMLVNREGKYTDTLRVSIRNFFEDRQGNLWIGTDGAGLLWYSPTLVNFHLLKIGFTRCIREFNRDIWIGTFKQGLWRLSPGLKSTQRVNPALFTNQMNFLDMTVDRNQRLWIATEGTLFVLNNNGAIVAQMPLHTHSAYFLESPDGSLFLSAYDHLYACNATPHRPTLTSIRSQSQVRRLIEWKGHWWVAGYSGLYRYDRKTKVEDALDFDKRFLLSSAPVYALLPVGETLWAGTDHGIICFTPEGKTLQPSGLSEKMKNEVVYSLLPDQQGRIWFSGNNGIGTIDKGDDRIVRFSLQNNLQSTEFNYNAAFAANNGWFYFGGIHGINSMMPGHINFIHPPPSVRLLTLHLSDTAFTDGIPPAHVTLRLNWKRAHCSGTVFTPDYLSDGTATYAFFLENYQSGWSQPSKSAAFSFRNLPPGKYQLWVRCTDGFANQGTAQCILTLQIVPPFWKTWWFSILLILFLVGASILGVVLFQRGRYNRQLVFLEHRNAVDRERLRISRDMHDEIGASLTQIAILSEIVKKQKEIPEPTLKLIGQISDISGTVVDDMGEIIWAMNPRNDNLPSFVSYLRQHTSEYLAVAGLAADFDFPEEVPDKGMTSEQRRNIFLVVKETLHNVVKHAAATRVVIRLNWSDDGYRLEMEITDNGQGFDLEAKNATGNGLTNIRKRIGNLNGTCTIESQPGKGTRIRFTVPLVMNTK